MQLPTIEDAESRIHDVNNKNTLQHSQQTNEQAKADTFNSSKQ